MCGDKILTPELDHQKLPGSRDANALNCSGAYRLVVEVRPVSRDEVLSASEIWLSSSTKELALWFPWMASQSMMVARDPAGQLHKTVSATPFSSP